MISVPADLRVFRVLLLGGEEVELRLTWPAMTQIERWLGIGWTAWDLRRHSDLAAIVAGGMLHVRPNATPQAVMEQLDLYRIAEYRQIVDDLISYAHSGKTRAERDAERMAREEAAPGEAPAARP